MPPRPKSELDQVNKVLATLTDVVQDARAMPMSASCVVNRAEVLTLLEELGRRLPQAFDQAQGVLGEKAGVVDQGRREAERIVAAAQAERRRMLGSTHVLRDAEEEAERVLEEAREQSEAMRAEVEDYIDAKLANFEIVLTKTLEAVDRGRQKLSGRHELDALRERSDDSRPLPG